LRLFFHSTHFWLTEKTGQAGDSLTTGNYNVAVGHLALSTEDGDGLNTAVGHRALQNSNTGADGYNTALGYFAGNANTTGVYNVFVGAQAGDSVTEGYNNIIIGYNAAASAVDVDNEITLGNVNISALRCQVTSITSLSDKRDKTNINTLDKGLEFVDALKPVKFDWKTRDGSKKGVKDIGFIAQDLQELDDEYTNLVYDKNPERLEASYGRLVPILVKAVQELSAEVKQLKQQLNN